MLDGRKVAVFSQIWNPRKPDTTHVAINTRANPPCIFHTYSAGEKPAVSGFVPDIIVMPIEDAMKKYDFRPL